MDLWSLNLRHLAALAATVRLGSLSAAARAVSLTQPALTQGLAKLERQLGTPMFDRRPGGMTPTPIARLFAARIDAALAHIASPRVTTAQMHALIALAEAGSYAGASVTTGRSPPTLHRALGDLAIGLRADLVERRGKGVALTATGRRLVRALRLARAELVAGLSEIAAAQGRETGRITLGAMPLARARLLPAAVVAFHRSHPEVDVRIVEGSLAELVEPLRDGDIDVLIGALRENASDDLVQMPLFEDRPVVVCRAGHPLAGGADLAALAARPWAVSAPGTPLRRLWESMFAGGGVTVPAVRIECGSVITLREILRASDFLTLLSPEQVAVELAAGWLATIPPPVPLRRTIGTTTRAGWRPTALQAAFVATLTAQAARSVDVSGRSALSRLRG